MVMSVKIKAHLKKFDCVCVLSIHHIISHLINAYGCIVVALVSASL